MDRSGISRRDFLETSGRAAASVVVVLTSGTTLLMAPNGAWAMTLEAISGADGATLLRALRVIYPHDALGDQYYAAVVEALDQEARASAEAADLLKNGVAGLDRAFPVPFLELSQGHQLAALRAMEASPFFQTIRSKAVVALYNNPRVWQAFGYEGASYEIGGYLENGFDDLGWLAQPSAEASPPAEL